MYCQSYLSTETVLWLLCSILCCRSVLFFPHFHWHPDLSRWNCNPSSLLSDISALNRVSMCYVINYKTRRGSYKKQKLLTLHNHLGSPPVFGGVGVAHLFSFLCCVFCFVCLLPVSCVPNIASCSGLSILCWSFGFLLTFTSSYSLQWGNRCKPSIVLWQSIVPPFTYIVYCF